jgi:diguanylate cyclase (GGDEF)-like protein
MMPATPFGCDSVFRFREVFIVSVLPVLAAILATSAVFLLLWHLFVNRPLQKLIDLMTQAPSKDFLIRAPSRAEDVIGRLYQSFNRLLERITTLDAFKLETERQLIFVQEELKYRQALEEKSRIIGETNKTLEARLKELWLLYEFSQQVSATLEVDELYNTVERFIGDHLGFHEFALLVLDDRDDSEHKLVVKVARGFRDEKRVLGMSFQEGEGITGRTLQKGETIYIPDTSHSEDYLHYKGEKQEDGSFLSMPLLFKKKVVGVLNMFRKGTDAFSAEETRFLNTLTVEIAIAVVNARLYSKTRELSVRDELTQLYNRRHFQEMLPLEIKRSQRFRKPLALLMIDIDYFKKFNDRYGHLAGDECLKEFVHVVNAKIREVDFFARFGGEEFVLILPGTPKADGVTVAEKILGLVREHVFRAGDEGKTERLTVSIGVAAYPDDAKTVEELIDAADIVLYEAKNGGRNRVGVCENVTKGSLAAQ